MMPDQSMTAANRMLVYGCNFIRHLGALYIAADADEQRRIVNTWPKHFATYYNSPDAYEQTDATAHITDCASEGM